MKKNSLSNKGLSLSQAQSISNLCNQRAREIDVKLSGVNNYSKTVKADGETHILVAAQPLPANVVDLISEKARLYACQAFLMENIKAKDGMLNEIRKESADISSVVMPERPARYDAAVKMLPQVKEDWGWEQLSVTETNEFIQAEAYAAHIGQFIHNGSILDNLRSELPTIKPVEWMNIKDGEKTPVKILVHHKSEDLLFIHETFAKLHREHEQRVNYFKAKVKNLVTEENARIAKHNADAQIEVEKKNKDLQNQWEVAYSNATDAIRTIQTEFEKTRQARIKEVAAMRIAVDARFQPVVDVFLGQLGEE